MGACNFTSGVRRNSYPLPELKWETVNGVQVGRCDYADWPDAKAAFQHLAEEDRYENGHSYSGGIGMKHDFIHIATVKTDQEAYDLADKLVDECDPRIDDKWGPAGCITVTDGELQFLFFGWASS